VRLDESDTVWRGGLPLTSRLRTLVDLLACSTADQSRTLLFRAVQQDWLDESGLRDQIARLARTADEL